MADYAVDIDIVRVEIAPAKAEIKVTYIVRLQNKVYEGIIGGGETQFSDETLGPQILELVEKIQAQIKIDLGLAPDSDQPVDSLTATRDEIEL
jgi:hypothetical protein